MRGVNTPYTGGYQFSSLGYYIHEHAIHIGMAEKGKAVTDDALAEIYSSKRSKVAAAVKQQYRSLFRSSVNQKQPSEEVFELINSAMSNDDIMTEINHQLGSQMSEILNIDKMKRLMELEIATTTPRINGSVDFKKILQNKVPVEEFNKILIALNEACKLISNKEQGQILGKALLNVTKGLQGDISRRKFGEKLMAALVAYKKQLNMTPISAGEKTAIEGILDNLEPFARNITTGKKGKAQKEDIGFAGIKKMVEDIFNTGFAEAISASLTNSAKKQIVDAMSSIKVIGGNQVKVALTDIFGNYTGQEKELPQQGKADAIFENIKLQIQEQGTSENKEIRISIGISDKFYKGASFPGISSTYTKANGSAMPEKYSAGSGSYLSNILNEISKEKRWLYLTYNTIAHGKTYSIAQAALHDIIALRSIIYLFGARNTSDFAQFMFVNGQIVPLWDIIMASIQTSLAVTESQLYGGAISNAPFNISLGNNRDKAQDAAERIDDEFERVRTVNNYINNITISAHLDLKKFKALGGSIFSKF